MAKRVAAIQSNYIPWKGYFDLINSVDECILLDQVQYTRRDWRNRNRIKVGDEAQWLTVPVEVKGRYHQRIDETRIADPEWAERHWKTLQHGYRRAAHFMDVEERIAPLYLERTYERLSDLNRTFIEAVAAWLGITTAITWSTEYGIDGVRGELILGLCRAAGAEVYISGPAARSYLDEATFAEHGIAVEWADYSGYPEYPQLGSGFDHHVSILDLLFHTGAGAPRYMRSFGAG
jgi:hypothetical protein